jgi:hypothetical protein
MALTSIISTRHTQAQLPAAPLSKNPSQSLIPFGVLGDIGAELSTPINTMREFVHDVREARGVSEEQMTALAAAIESANYIARSSQQIARLAEGRLRQSHEKICLDELLQQALVRLTLRGISVEKKIKPVEIIVDAALLSSLVDASLNWGAAQGEHLTVSLNIKSWPEHAVLIVKSASPLAGTAETSQTDSLNWHLLTHLAQTMGVKVEREMGAEAGSSLLLEFPRTVCRLEGLTSTEIHTGDDSSFQGTRSMAGQRVLLIANDMLIRAGVDEASRLLGLRVDSVTTVSRARQHLRLDMPHVIIIDEKLHDGEFDAMVADAKSNEPNIGLVEIANDSNTFEISSWMDNSMTRLSRDVLKAKLPSVLSLELARAF